LDDSYHFAGKTAIAPATIGVNLSLCSPIIEEGLRILRIFSNIEHFFRNTDKEQKYYQKLHNETHGGGGPAHVGACGQRGGKSKT